MAEIWLYLRQISQSERPRTGFVATVNVSTSRVYRHSHRYISERSVDAEGEMRVPQLQVTHCIVATQQVRLRRSMCKSQRSSSADD